MFMGDSEQKKEVNRTEILKILAGNYGKENLTGERIAREGYKVGIDDATGGFRLTWQAFFRRLF